MNEKIKQIADFYGCKDQANKTIEELNELAVAVAHYERRRGSEDRKNLIEEIADAEIMLSQIKYMYGINYEDICAVKIQKVERTTELIESQKGELR